MSKNLIVLGTLLVVLLGVYVFFFTDWFDKRSIQIIATIRPTRPSAIQPRADTPPVYPVSFSFDGNYRFTEIKVVRADEYASNKFAPPLWHMISDSNSVPIKNFYYGMPVKGMKPSVPRARPEPLSPNEQYLILLDTGDLKGMTNFATRAAQGAPGR
jgi:hypothetical protein